VRLLARCEVAESLVESVGIVLHSCHRARRTQDDRWIGDIGNRSLEGPLLIGEQRGRLCFEKLNSITHGRERNVDRVLARGGGIGHLFRSGPVRKC